MADYLNTITKNNLRELKKAAGKGPVLITTHHNPDPDGLASGLALATLLDKVWSIPSRLIYTGIVARAENRAMLQHLTYEWELLHSDKWDIIKDFSVVALVDSQPGSGNNHLPKDFIPQIVFDHHRSFSSVLDGVSFFDIRTDMGAVSSMLFQYLEVAEITIAPRLATALFYGLKTDTMGLSRGRSKCDEYVYFKLLSTVDHFLLSLVEKAQLPLIYFHALNNALRGTRIYGQVVVTKLGNTHQPDLPAEIADLTIRLEGIQASLCMGVYNDTLNISLRTRTDEIDAGELINKVVGPIGMSGGHNTMAGGQVNLDKNNNKRDVEIYLTKGFLYAMEEKNPGMPLLRATS